MPGELSAARSSADGADGADDDGKGVRSSGGGGGGGGGVLEPRSPVAASLGGSVDGSPWRSGGRSPHVFSGCACAALGRAIANAKASAKAARQSPRTPEDKRSTTGRE